MTFFFCTTLHDSNSHRLPSAARGEKSAGLFHKSLATPIYRMAISILTFQEYVKKFVNREIQTSTKGFSNRCRLPYHRLQGSCQVRPLSAQKTSPRPQLRKDIFRLQKNPPFWDIEEYCMLPPGWRRMSPGLYRFQSFFPPRAYIKFGLPRNILSGFTSFL